MRRKWKFVIPALALLCTCLLFQFVLFIGYVPTESMEPTLKKGSIIVGSRLFGELKVGNIIVFRHEEKLLVKRIAAIEGDMVEHKQTVLCVPNSKFYVLGDNRGCSTDSRSWEDPFINSNSVIAIVLGDRTIPVGVFTQSSSVKNFFTASCIISNMKIRAMGFSRDNHQLGVGILFRAMLRIAER